MGAMAEETSIAGPGFINVRLSAGWLADSFGRTLQIPARDRATMAVETVVVDYSGPNIAKQMHVGICAARSSGRDQRALAFQGHKVIRQNHVGDWGTQFGRVCWRCGMRQWRSIHRSKQSWRS